VGDLSQNQSAMSVYIMGTDINGVETFPAKTTPNQDLSTADLLVQGGTQGALVVGTSAVAARVGVANFANRKALTVTPDGDIYWGYTNGVTTASGTIIYKNQQITFSVSDAVTIWLIASTNRNVRVTEGG